MSGRPEDLPKGVQDPFPGLRPFERAESEIFYGRGEQIDQMLSQLEENRFLAVVGSSGSGKSSLVRAGLLPALEEGFLTGAGPDWYFVVMRPGGHPFCRLAEAFEASIRGGDDDTGDAAFIQATLQSGPKGLLEAVKDELLPEGSNVLVLVDQFEEIFRFHRGERDADPSAGSGIDEAAAFVSMLLETCNSGDLPIQIILTMRSDFIGDCELFRGLPEAVSGSQFLTPRMTRSQLEDVITGPLDLFHSTADPGLVTRILNDVGNEPDHLPLMQHALMRTWFQAGRRSGEACPSNLTIEDYEAVGGFGGALSMHAEEAWAELNEKQHRIAEKLFRSLSEQTDESPLTRRLAELREVAEVADVSPEKVAEVVGIFQKEHRNFLVANPSPPGEESVLDISHEALMRQWTRLREWIENESRSSRNYRDILDRARTWNRTDKKWLWLGPELGLALDWREREKPTDAWSERYNFAGEDFQLANDFLDSSKTALRRRKIRNRLWLVATMAALAAGLIAALFYGQEVKKAYDLAEKYGREKADLLVVAETQRNAYAELANTFGVALSEKESALAAARAARSSMAAEYATRGKVGEAVLHFAKTLDKLENPSQRLAFRNLLAFHSSFGLPLYHEDRLYGARFSPSGDYVVTASADGIARVWDTRNGHVVGTADDHPKARVRDISFAPGQEKFVTCSLDGRIRIWEIRPGKEVKLVRELVDPTPPKEPYPIPISARFSESGDRIVSAHLDGFGRIWDAGTGEILARLPHDKRVNFAAFNPEGDRVVTASQDGTAALWNVPAVIEKNSSGEDPEALGKTVLSHDGQSVAFAAFSPRVSNPSSPELVVTVGEGGLVRIWDVATGSRLLDSKGEDPLSHSGSVRHVAFNSPPEGSPLRIVTSSDDGTVGVWEQGTPSGRDEAGSSGGDSGSRLDPGRFTLKNLFLHDGAVRWAEFSPAGNRLISGASDGLARLWDLNTGDKIGYPFQHDGWVTGVQFHPSEELILTSSRDGSARVWKTSPVKVAALEVDSENPLDFAGFDPETSDVFTISGDRYRTWNKSSGLPSGESKPIDDSVGKLIRPPLRPESQTGELKQNEKLWEFSPTTNGRGLMMKVTEDKDGNDEGVKVTRTLQPGDKVHCLDISPRNDRVITGSDDFTARLWDFSVTEDPVDRVLKHGSAVTMVAFSPGGDKVITGTAGGEVRFWDVVTGHPLTPELVLSKGLPIDQAVFSAKSDRVIVRSRGTDVSPAACAIIDFPPPATDDLDALRLCVEVRTGLYLDEKSGAVRRLGYQEWQDRKIKLFNEENDGSDVRSWEDLSEDESKELRAPEAPKKPAAD